MKIESCFCFVAARFVDSSTKMSFANFLSVLSVYRIHHPDTIWFHCYHLPDVDDLYWNQLWKSVPLTFIYHEQQTSKRELESGLNPARDSAVVATLLKHGGIFVDWNILVVRSLNPLRNYSTCFSKVCLLCCALSLTLEFSSFIDNNANKSNKCIL